MSSSFAYIRPPRATGLAGTALAASVSFPAAVIVAGVAALGTGAVSWIAAIAAGVVATLAFTLYEASLRALRFVWLDALELLTVVLAGARRPLPRALLAIVHHAVGGFLAVAWAYGAALAKWPANWATGLLWGLVLWGLAFVLMAVASTVHVGIRDRDEGDDPATRATSTSRGAPVVSLFGHLLYGLVLGLAYPALIR